MTTYYCSASDVYAYGLPRGAVSNAGRLAASALATTNLVTLDVHGFELNERVTFRAEADGNLPAPLVEGTTYYVDPAGDSTFYVTASAGGSPIDLTSDGESVVVIAAFPIDTARAWASRVIDDMLPAHVVPLVEPFPEIVVMTAAELAGWKLASRAGSTSVALTAIVDAAQKRVARWAQGIPIRGVNSPPRAGLSAVVALPYVDRTGWNRFGGI